MHYVTDVYNQKYRQFDLARYRRLAVRRLYLLLLLAVANGLWLIAFIQGPLEGLAAFVLYPLLIIIVLVLTNRVDKYLAPLPKAVDDV